MCHTTSNKVLYAALQSEKSKWWLQWITTTPRTVNILCPPTKAMSRLHCSTKDTNCVCSGSENQERKVSACTSIIEKHTIHTPPLRSLVIEATLETPLHQAYPHGSRGRSRTWWPTFKWPFHLLPIHSNEEEMQTWTANGKHHVSNTHEYFLGPAHRGDKGCWVAPIVL